MSELEPTQLLGLPPNTLYVAPGDVLLMPAATGIVSDGMHAIETELGVTLVLCPELTEPWVLRALPDESPDLTTSPEPEAPCPWLSGDGTTRCTYPNGHVGSHSRGTLPNEAPILRCQEANPYRNRSDGTFMLCQRDFGHEGPHRAVVDEDRVEWRNVYGLNLDTGE